MRRALAILPLVLASQTLGDGLYWCEVTTPFPNGGILRRADVDGDNPVTLFALAPFSVNVAGIAADERIGRVWWLHGSFTGSIIKNADFDGANELVFSEAGQGWGLWADTVNQRLYWVDVLGGCCGNQATGCDYFESGGPDLRDCIAIHDDRYGVIAPNPEVDQIAGMIYIGLYSELTRISLADGTIEPLGPIDAHAMAIDSIGHALYFIDDIAGSIRRMSLEGGDSEEIVKGDGEIPVDLDFDPVARRLYWVTPDGLEIQSSDTAGRDVVTMATHTRGHLINGLDIVRAALSGPDLNADGVVDGADLGVLLAAWGDCASGATCLGDLDGDGAVDGSDLGLLLSQWTS